MRYPSAVSLLAILTALATPAVAQQAGAQPAAVQTDDADAGIGDIIVTANRRAESIQKASVSLEVLDASRLEQGGVTRVADLQSVVPSLSAASSGQNISTYIRGVGSFSTDANADSSIAYNINGVFISRPAGVGGIFFDLERVEVLKGPQGTLYGRNASGGAINLITRRPGDHVEVNLAAEYGNFNQLRLNMGVGGPVSDSFGVRAAVQYVRHDGYLTDGYNDQDDLSARLTGLWKPSDAVSVLLVGEYFNAGGMGSAGAFRSLRQAMPSDPWTGPSQAPQPQAALIGPDKIRDDGYVDTRVYAVSAEANIDLNFATLTILPAYRRTEPATLTYQPGFYFRPTETADQTSIEARLSGDTGSLRWVAGGFYFHEDQTQEYTLLARPIQQNHVVTSLFTRSYAFFADANFSLLDNFRLIGGIRYSHDRKGQDGTSTASLPVPVIIDNYGRRTDDNVSFRAGFEFDAAPESMLFATVATGYKAGGFVPSVLSPANGFEPEKITAWTVGSRNRFFDDRIQLNLEGFYWRYRDKQERFLGALPSGGVGLLTTNAGRATIYGANIDLTARIGAGTLNASAEYLHTRYDSFTYTVANSGPLAPLGYSSLATGCKIGALTVHSPTLSTQPIDCSGQPLPHAPKWSGAVRYTHPIELGGGHRLEPSASMKFASEMWLSPDFIKSAHDDGYAAFDADLTWRMPSGVSVTGWVRNIGNQVIYSGGYRYPFSFKEPIGDPTVFYADIRPPRTYGVTLRYDY